MSEEKFYKNQLRTMFKGFGMSERIESGQTTQGRPDVSLCLKQGKVWDIELKYYRANSRFKPKIRPSQHRWFKQRARVNGNCCVLYKVEGKTTSAFYLISRENVPLLPKDHRKWPEWSELRWMGKIDPLELKRYLDDA
jgi:hypothetical protein